MNLTIVVNSCANTRLIGRLKTLDRLVGKDGSTRESEYNIIYINSGKSREVEDTLAEERTLAHIDLCTGLQADAGTGFRHSRHRR